MDEKHCNSVAENQAVGQAIQQINNARNEAAAVGLNQVAQDLERSQMELKNTYDTVNRLIESNRGGAKGMHGFVGEIEQVGVSNSRSFVHGQEASYKLINDNGPVDYMKGEIPIQQKACAGGGKLGLDHALLHSEKYPNFVNGGGIYQIPKDFYETYERMLRTTLEETREMRKADFRLWKYIHEYAEQHPEIKFEPMELTYDEIQVGSLEDTLSKVAAENEEISNARRLAIIEMHRATIVEGLKVGAVAAAIEGATDGIVFIIAKARNGVHIWQFDGNDWKDLGVQVLKGAGKGAVRGAAVYALTNAAGVSAPVATAAVTATIGVGSEIVGYVNGEISGKECAKNSAMHVGKAGASAGGAYVGSKYLYKMIPASIRISHPVISGFACVIIGSELGSMLWEGLKGLF